MTRLDPDECRRRFGSAPRAVLGTIGSDGAADLVPVTFALVDGPHGDVVVTAVDHKPKRTDRLVRLANVRADARVTLLCDHWDDDWGRLWWVRAEGLAVVHERDVALPAEAAAALAALVDRYPPYRARPPAGPVIVTAITRWVGWAAA